MKIYITWDDAQNSHDTFFSLSQECIMILRSIDLISLWNQLIFDRKVTEHSTTFGWHSQKDKFHRWGLFCSHKLWRGSLVPWQREARGLTDKIPVGNLSIGRGEHSEVHVVHPKMGRDGCQNYPLDITTQSTDI